MRKGIKTFIVVSTAAVLSLGALSLTACDSGFTPLGGNFAEGAVKSNGGFVAEKGEYVYFINGVETYTSDNTYGTPVKGALMRIKKADVAAHKNTAETVIPSLIVSADYTSGIYIYGDRVYYATPTNVKNTSGEVENSYLDFKSAKLNGSDIQSYFRVAENDTSFRYVETGDNVYLAYESSNELHSYNTADGTDTVLAANVGGYVFDSVNKTNPWIYYTMAVSANMDSAASVALSYNQIYRVRADRTEAAYEYEWDWDYLNENNDGKAPYTNLGEIVLDGIGTLDVKDPPKNLTHGLDEENTPVTPNGYTYTLQSYTNDGIYFTRTDLASSGSSTTGMGGSLYYLAESKLVSIWNSVSGNGSLDVLAQPTDTNKASSSALFYLENGTHHYLYVQDENIVRADVKSDGSAEETVICSDASGATLLWIDSTSDATYKYVYFSRTNGAGTSVERAVYNGSGRNYDVLGFDGEDNSGYKPVKVLDLQHASGWYPVELIDGYLYFADAESIGSVSYSYVSVVDLNKDGKLMNNVQIEELNDKYKAITDSSAKKGFLAKASEDVSANASEAMRYFFFTGNSETKYEDTLVYENIQEAIALDKKPDFLYSEEEQAAIKAYVEGTGDAQAIKDYRTRDAFINRLGELSEADEEALHDYWKEALQHFTPEEEEEGLPAWAWALIGVAIGLVVVGGALLTYFLIRRKQKLNKASESKEEQFHVDTTDDRSVDVYADEPVDLVAKAQEELAEELTAPEEVLEEVEASEEAPAETAEPEQEEAPAEEPETVEPEETEESENKEE